MDKNNNKTNKTEKNNQKGMNRTEFAQEYSIDTGKNEKTIKPIKQTRQISVTKKGFIMKKAALIPREKGLPFPFLRGRKKYRKKVKKGEKRC
ncbi:hypothetical protein [Anaerotignum faecicola]|uniref:Uncharacterized protein n=1 Tax=Anaerotignum faecicola TaxID=2358141 RepID=A0A401LET3_9FIRM|nr:hypothetical protein [Anaerotignum faecicola]GCB30050.1 hypothetical protein KGMB03357_17110 [Anaerotignum faecicola]